MKALVIALALTGMAFAQGNNQTRTRTTEPHVGDNVHDPDIDFYDSISDYFRQSPRAVEAIAQKGIPAHGNTRGTDHRAEIVHVAEPGYRRSKAGEKL